MRNLQVQQGANGDQQQKSMQRGITFIREIYCRKIFEKFQIKQLTIVKGKPKTKVLVLESRTLCTECILLMEAGNVDKDARYLVHTVHFGERIVDRVFNVYFAYSKNWQQYR